MHAQRPIDLRMDIHYPRPAMDFADAQEMMMKASMIPREFFGKTATPAKKSEKGGKPKGFTIKKKDAAIQVNMEVPQCVESYKTYKAIIVKQVKPKVKKWQTKRSTAKC